MRHATLEHLVEYTGWQRDLWQTWFEREGPGPLALTTGPNGDGRFPTIGALIRHIFSAELRYMERIAALPLTDPASVPSNEATALFQFGTVSRGRFRELLRTLPPPEWVRPREFTLLNATVRLSPHKIVLHVLTHEIRHWAQVATLLRLQGHVGAGQDLLFSPVAGEPVTL